MAELKEGAETFYAKSRKEWRKWLEKNHGVNKTVWLIIHKKHSKTPCVTYPEAVEEALCFGWIDAKSLKKDEESYYQSFTTRKPRSNWSKINKARVANLVKGKLMTAAGLDAIKIAKQNGAWNASDDIEKTIMPADLKQHLNKNKAALKNFNAFPPSSRKIIFYWIQSARKPETRLKRIENTVMLAAKNIRANQ